MNRHTSNALLPPGRRPNSTYCKTRPSLRYPSLRKPERPEISIFSAPC